MAQTRAGRRLVAATLGREHGPARTPHWRSRPARSSRSTTATCSWTADRYLTVTPTGAPPPRPAGASRPAPPPRQDRLVSDRLAAASPWRGGPDRGRSARQTGRHQRTGRRGGDRGSLLLVLRQRVRARPRGLLRAGRGRVRQGNASTTTNRPAPAPPSGATVTTATAQHGDERGADQERDDAEDASHRRPRAARRRPPGQRRGDVPRATGPRNNAGRNAAMGSVCSSPYAEAFRRR